MKNRRKRKNGYPLTQKYMIAPFPGMVQALQSKTAGLSFILFYSPKHEMKIKNNKKNMLEYYLSWICFMYS